MRGRFGGGGLVSYYVRERSFGSFERSFEVPDSVDTAKIEATFRKGVLTLMLPKSAEAQKAEKKIAIKAARSSFPGHEILQSPDCAQLRNPGSVLFYGRCIS